MSDAMLGIDFGTCYSSAAVRVDGTPRPVKLGHNLTAMPSSVCLKDDGTLAVGTVAENLMRRRPERYRREFKLELGSDDPFYLGDRPFRAEELVAAVLARLKAEAEARFLDGRAFTSAVLTVPADYEAHRRAAMDDAGMRAGFGQVTLVEEPVAAAVYYLWQNGARDDWGDGGAVLVYDLGGGTFDAALLRRTHDGYTQLAPPVSRPIGGVEFDRRIYAHLTASLPAGARAAVEARDPAGMMARLLLADACERIKRQLSEEECAEEVLLLDGHPRAELRRDTFEELIAGSVEETVEACRGLVRAAGVAPAEVAGVLLIGGSTRVPYVRRALERGLGRPLFQTDDPELAVSLGAALHAGAPSPQTVAAARAQYRAACRLAFADGVLDPAEVEGLEALRQELALTPQQAAAVEEELGGRPPPRAPAPPPAPAPLFPSTPQPGAGTSGGDWLLEALEVELGVRPRPPQPFLLW